MPVIILILLLSACASPAPRFFGAERSEVVLDGIRFVVFFKETEAEVIRMGYLTRKQRDPVPQLMVQAAEVATGCRVIPNTLRSRLPGDTGEARVDLDCPG